MANHAAELFEVAADHGSVPVAENTAPDGVYPKAWDLPSWKRVLARPDVVIIPTDMCEHYLQPLDADVDPMGSLNDIASARGWSPWSGD